MIEIKINGKAVAAEEGKTILEAAAENGIHIPTLCHLKDICADGVCRMCVVSVKGAPRLQTACNTKAFSGMEIETHSPNAVESRKMTLDLICREHRMDCEYCSRYSDCELHALLREHGMDDRTYSTTYIPQEKDTSSPAIIRDHSKCVRCRRCEAVCEKQGVHAIGALWRAQNTKIGAVVPLPETGCIGCGQCLAVCPTGALSIKNENKSIRIAMNNGKQVVCAIAPYVCESGEQAGKLVSILHSIGFDKVADGSGFAAKAAEEAAEAVKAGEKGISPICPAAAKLTDKKPLGRHPEEIFNEWCKANVDNAYTVWISGCTALKAKHSCDAVITPDELNEMILRASVSRYTMREVWRDAPVSAFDKALDASELCDKLGEAVKSACGGNITLAEADGAPAVRKAEKMDFDFADFLACPGGCKNCGVKMR